MGAPSVRTRVLVAVVAVSLGVVAGVLPLIPPSAPGPASTADFDVDRATATVAEIAVEPRPLGSAANRRGRSKIVAALEESAVEVELHSFPAPDYYGSGGAVEGVNVLTRLEGQANTGAVVLIAHHDTVPQTPGAADDTSGVAILLEVVRALRAGAPLRNDVILLFTDGEEPAPRYGSTVFVDEHPWFDEVAFAINLEAIGSGGPSLLIDGAGLDEVVAALADSAPAPTAYSFLTALVGALGGSNTDFAPFRDAGVAGAEFAFAHGSSVYHTRRDTPDGLSARSLDQHGRNTLALVRHFGTLDLGALDESDGSTFFTVGRHTIVRYPGSLDTAVAVLALALAAAALHRRTARGSWRELGRLGAVVLGLVAVGALAWWAVGSWRSEMGLVEAEVWLAALASATVAFVLARRPFDATTLVLVWAGVAVVLSFTLPGAAAVFAWPAMIAAFVLWTPDQWGRLVGAAVCTVVTLVLAVPFVDLVFALAQPRPGNPDSELLAAAGIPIGTVALTTLLVGALFRAPDAGP